MTESLTASTMKAGNEPGQWADRKGVALCS